MGTSQRGDIVLVDLVDLDRRLAESEPDPELSAPLEASAGLNVGLDYLPGRITFDPVAGPRPDAAVASLIVLFRLVRDQRGSHPAKPEPAFVASCGAPPGAQLTPGTSQRERVHGSARRAQPVTGLVHPSPES